jgi:HEPN domain-containing protein
MPEPMKWEEWLLFANEDYEVALEVAATKGRTAILILHQSIEKYLKAVLIKRGELPDRSHDLVMLVRAIDPSLQFDHELWKAARELNYLLPRARYPSGGQQPTGTHVQKALEYAKLLQNFAKTHLSLTAD